MDFFLNLYLAAGVPFAIMGGVMASNRNRSVIGWALVCFLLDLIGVVILAVAGDANAGPQAEKAANFKKWKTLTEVDPDIAAAAARASAIGAHVEQALAEKYMVLNEKTYLNSIVELVTANPGSLPKMGEVNGVRYRVLEDGSHMITKGKLVGRKYPTYDDMLAAIS